MNNVESSKSTNQDIVWDIIETYFRDNPQSLVTHHIESYNDFFKKGIFQIFKEKNPIEIGSRWDDTIDDYRSKCRLYMGGRDGSLIYFGKPVIYDESRPHYMYPNEARLRNMTYAMTIHYDVEVEIIHILEEGELPTVIGGEEFEGGGNEEQYEEARFSNYKEGQETLDRSHIEDLHGGDEGRSAYVDNVSITGGGEGKEDETAVKEGKKMPMKKRTKKQLELAPAEMAQLREVTQKSMIGPNTQRQILVLEKIYLGKFPIMLQSDFCILSKLSRELRFSMGECKNDVGGYFIIDGKEKSIVPQEQFANNIMYVKKTSDDKYLYSADIRSVSENVAKPVRTMSVKLVAPTNSFTNLNIVVAVPNVRKPIPLFILFRALGILSDRAIIEMCLLDLSKFESMIDHFAPSVHDAGSVVNQRSALKYIAILTKGKTITHALEILCDYLLPHIGETTYIQKAYYLGYMVFRLLKVYLGIEQETNRDNYKFKRLETPGVLIGDLFREYYTIQLKEIHVEFEKRLYFNQNIYSENLYGLIHKNYREVFLQRTVDAGFKKAFKGGWGAQSHTARVGIVQDLNRLSFFSATAQMRKTNLHLDAGLKLVPPRLLHTSQWGYFDPIDTPDGGNIGLIKNLAISTYISRGMSREPMITWLRRNVVLKLIEELVPVQLSVMTKVFVNGYWCGAIEDPFMCCEKFKLFRRNALIPIHASISFDIKQNMILIYTDAGRLCRPIFYRDEATGEFSVDTFAGRRGKDLSGKGLSGKDLSRGGWTEFITGFHDKKIKDFVPNHTQIYELSDLYDGIDGESNPAKQAKFIEHKAIIDYIDTSESEDALIALTKKDISKYHTHLEIHPSFMFGMMENMVIFPENNPATRNAFSSGQSKQAVSLYHTNYQLRMDKSAVVLANGQIPLVKSRYMDFINHEENVYGENAIVAIMVYSGYNMEDSIIINEGALKRGLFRTTYYSTYETHEEKSRGDNGATIMNKIFARIEGEENIVGLKPGYDYSKLDKYGIIKENTPVDDKTVLIGVSAYAGEGALSRRDESKTPKKGQLGVVDKSFITEGEQGNRIAKVKVREIRIPTLGDKMASRAGQKGTVGIVLPESDIPFTKDGIRPDMIINPHAIPSRMTIGQLVECITGKASAMYGSFGDCTAFQNEGSKIGIYGSLLTKVGFHSSGNEVLYNGMTGEQIGAEIFIGPTYYMRLKHMVKDKVNFRALGPRTALTRQPVSGRANDGGLRIGEMERDGVLAHGATNFLTESMMERGDKYFFAVCNTTGMIAIYNPDKNLFMSPLADGPIKYSGSLVGEDMHVENITKYGRSFSLVSAPYSFKLLIQELQAMNVCMRIITEDNIEQMENLMFSDNTKKLTGFDIGELQKLRETMIQENRSTANINPIVPSERGGPIPEIPAVQTNVQLPYRRYEPTTPDLPTVLPVKPVARFEPTTPDLPTVLPAKPVARFEPTTPDLPTVLPVKPVARFEPTTPDLPSETQELKVGGRVMYRGKDIKPRVWNIKHIGDKYVTIDTEDYDGLEPENALQVVEKNHIYPFHPSYLQNSPIGQFEGDMPYGQSIPAVSDPVFNNVNPSITGVPDIKPVFNIVVGDHNKVTSSDGDATPQKMANNDKNSLVENVPMNDAEPKEIDFKQGFMIKKME